MKYLPLTILLLLLPLVPLQSETHDITDWYHGNCTGTERTYFFGLGTLGTYYIGRLDESLTAADILTGNISLYGLMESQGADSFRLLPSGTLWQVKNFAYGIYEFSFGGETFRTRINFTHEGQRTIANIPMEIYSGTITIPDNTSHLALQSIYGFFNDNTSSLEYGLDRLESLLHTQNQRLYDLLVIGCLIFGSLLFLHFGRFMRW
jgi:hypothetical protein